MKRNNREAKTNPLKMFMDHLLAFINKEVMNWLKDYKLCKLYVATV